MSTTNDPVAMAHIENFTEDVVATREMLTLQKYRKFWVVADAVAAMSKDPSTKVGAVALDENMNIVATGYNGFPRGVTDTFERYADRDIKLKMVSHAEQNLVAQAAYAGHSLKGSTVVLTSLYPCSSCAKSLIQAGVRRIITVDPKSNPRWEDEAKWASLMFYEAGVEILFDE